MAKKRNTPRFTVVKKDPSKGKDGVIVVRLSPEQIEARNKFLANASLSAVSKKGGTVTSKQAAKYVRDYIRRTRAENVKEAG